MNRHWRIGGKMLLKAAPRVGNARILEGTGDEGQNMNKGARQNMETRRAEAKVARFFMESQTNKGQAMHPRQMAMMVRRGDLQDTRKLLNSNGQCSVALRDHDASSITIIEFIQTTSPSHVLRPGIIRP
jgi:hypothetical protein